MNIYSGTTIDSLIRISCPASSSLGDAFPLGLSKRDDNRQATNNMNIASLAPSVAEKKAGVRGEKDLSPWILLAVSLLCLFASPVALAHEGHEHSSSGIDPASRNWTFTDSGVHLHATYVSSLDGKVSVRKHDGSIVALPISQLSKADQTWIENRVSAIRELNEQRNRRVVLVQSKSTSKAPPIAATFEPFAKLQQVKYRQDDNFFYVESNSMPNHRMMVGITAWQQQVPIPQPYFGNNAWRIPLHPVVAKNPMSAKSHFFRGAIALAANGVPIFNPIKNDGRTDTLIAGELDEFGGHCGRADDYHYHIAPTHLQNIVGQDKPVAYALDGYPIYGFTEPDGSKVEGLDAFNGHTAPELGYHYHATKTYPYLNGGFHGEVSEVGGQVDPQPRTGGVREALPPWRGAKITAFENESNKRFSVKVEVGKETHHVNYAINDDGSVKFDFVAGNGKVTTETYSPRAQGRGGPGEGGSKGGPDRGGKRGGDRPPRDEKGPPPGGADLPPREGKGPDGPRPDDRPSEALRGETDTSTTPPLIIAAKKSGNFKLSSPSLVEGQPLPNEFNGNGEGATPPLEWKGIPEGTKSFALVMDHIDRDNYLKTYWNLYAIPPTVTSLPKNVKGIGKIGATWKRDQAYVPPHSSGGAKQTYTLHLYALSIVPQFDDPEGAVTREALLSKIKDHILDSSDLNVTYQRPAGEVSGGKGGPDRNGGQSGKGRPVGEEKGKSDENGKGEGKSGGGGKGGSGLGNYTVPPPANNVPEHLYNIILGRPTDNGLTVRALFHKDATAYVTYGIEPGRHTEKTSVARFKAKETHDFVLTALKPNHRYYYKLVYKAESGREHSTDEFAFHTQRQSGSSFVFTVTSDSHLDENTSGEVYLRTLANALNDSPDFHFELGDTFMTGKYVRPELSEPQYLAQRYYLGSLCHSASLFFALGNHDGESGSRGSTTWATKKRKELIPNPFPNGFYTGNEQKEDEIGFPEDYYQWKWGDAQFIVLDPFRYTKGRGNSVDHWSWTLGEQQYQWLRSSLKESDAKYKFVFLHHLVGGTPPHARGGIEAVPFWEWGGKGTSGENEFAKNRPGWEAPIHDLLVKHGATIVFHGHDHMFIKQDLDGIVYQLVPQPGHPRSGNTRTATEYGYLSGETQSSSGHIRVRVGSDGVRADYVRAFLPQSESSSNKNGDVSFSYVAPDRSAKPPTKREASR